MYWKLTALSRLFHSSSFGESFLVSTKEFLWDLSFIVKYLFSRTFGPLILTKSPEFAAPKGGNASQAGLEVKDVMKASAVYSRMTKFHDVWKLRE